MVQNILIYILKDQKNHPYNFNHKFKNSKIESFIFIINKKRMIDISNQYCMISNDCFLKNSL